MKLEIISPEGLQFEGETESVSLPGEAGLFDILPHHSMLIGALQKGVIRYLTHGEWNELPIKSGFVEVKDDHLSVCIE
ncbi:F0F1 ATP synthase subunit epsilon [Parabacteroides sp. AM08-6]|uniref:F0F1 ATP synthase subunit epsilon n=1 Tax=Parabacteroides sp. AM08-6 TaxID=2292053 RepID=UPI000F00B972|nr:F0F1 ATP synthase subunit epsilon [Parabacteroides sp. AM08-6]RHJ86614.1 F0F1 ATP synthase subunit epsilon [Parabacteroides sp. AM08-6]